jgi:hypothetical protein
MQVQHVDWEKEGGLKISKVHWKDIRSAIKNSQKIWRFLPNLSHTFEFKKKKRFA